MVGALQWGGGESQCLEADVGARFPLCLCRKHTIKHIDSAYLGK